MIRLILKNVNKHLNVDVDLETYAELAEICGISFVSMQESWKRKIVG
jgi:hypothetical protein